MLKKLLVVGGLSLALTGCFGGDEAEKSLVCDFEGVEVTIEANDKELTKVEVEGAGTDAENKDFEDQIKDGWETRDDGMTMDEFLEEMIGQVGSEEYCELKV